MRPTPLPRFRRVRLVPSLIFTVGYPGYDGGDESVMSQRNVLSLAQFERARSVQLIQEKIKRAGMLAPELER
jgi:hypothetical protein